MKVIYFILAILCFLWMLSSIFRFLFDDGGISDWKWIISIFIEFILGIFFLGGALAKKKN